ncbi:DNA gyrase subunit A [Aquicella siphonis]|uniref:DNA gyrase subunit A n=1 Tax=Aquicella siphonis TaxID=254247 RepID=A0A5E4PGQ6_9COXI|nr:DNA gyrase subunit A [Aquicella siphonis]VVC76064.1 DNA gyrase subunit A [Aquicella siphonis]
MDNPVAKEVQKVSVETELKKSYLDYAMSVIVGRALPDVRDGLKPVHRRVLFAMHELGNDWNKPYKKSARIVGDVIGKYHPHGDTAVYDTIVRMAQPFSMRYLLVDGQGNFGSIDGDAAAAMRYTEIRMSRFAHALLADIEKETVDFTPNYDENELMPAVLPTRIPHLLVNGSSGIAVGMATNIPPHNLTEIINACLALIDNPEISISEIMEHVPGPDFPTGAIIQGKNGIYEAYHTGRGRVVVRAKTHVETDEKAGKDRIVITELPYQVNKARLVERIAELVKEKKIEGITALRDESDKQGMRVVIELKRGENVDVIQNNLFVQTQMQSVFGINMVALADGQPRVLNIKQLLEAFVQHRREVVTRRTVFDLRKARDRVHILEGLAVALLNIDAMIALIKQAKDPGEAKIRLLERPWQAADTIEILTRAGRHDAITHTTEMYGLSDEGYRLSPEQAQAILEMRLHRLTGLEQDKIIAEHKELKELIRQLTEILQNPARLMQVIREELDTVKTEFGDGRRTEIAATEEGEVLIEDLIPDEEVVVTLSHEGYVKTQLLEVYQAQHRGGRGKSATSMKEEDFMEYLIAARTHDTVLCFTNHGKVYWLKVYQLPQANRASRGRPIVNILPLAEGEKVNAFLPVREYLENRYVVMATSMGSIKKVSLVDFSRPRSSGIIAIALNEGDYLVQADITDGNRDIMLFTDAGKVVRFHESKVRCMGRQAVGVRGVKLQEGQKVVSLIVSREGEILTATENGYGKRTALDEYRVSGRGGQGVISIQVSERNGKVVSAVQVNQEDEVMLISNKGTLVRVPAAEISVIGRNTQGVRLIQLGEGEVLVSLERIANIKGEQKE